VFVTHFGPIDIEPDYLDRFRQALHESARAVRDTLTMSGTDAERTAHFIDWLRQDVRRAVGEEDARRLELAAPFDQLWAGLARYWRKRHQPTVGIETSTA
jgi:phosphoglycerate-specific signal transduction histidine kinase